MAASERFQQFDDIVDSSSSETITCKRWSALTKKSGNAYQSRSGTRVTDIATSTSITKSDLADRLFEQVGLSKREAKDLVDTFFAEINSALERGESVRLTGFGNFKVRDKTARPGRNPKSGVEVNIPPRRVATFHASQKLKDTLATIATEGTPVGRSGR